MSGGWGRRKREARGKEELLSFKTRTGGLKNKESANKLGHLIRSLMRKYFFGNCALITLKP